MEARCLAILLALAALCVLAEAHGDRHGEVSELGDSAGAAAGYGADDDDSDAEAEVEAEYGAPKPYEEEMPSDKDKQRFIEDRAEMAAKDLMESNTKPETPVTVDREIVAVLGTFELKPGEGSAPAYQKPDADATMTVPNPPKENEDMAKFKEQLKDAEGKDAAVTLLETGESNPVLLPNAALAQIRAAQQIVNMNVGEGQTKKFADQYLEGVKHGRNRLESKTIETLSQQLQKANKNNAILMSLEKLAHGMIAAPKIGDTTSLSLGEFGAVNLKVDGWRYADGSKFLAPSGDQNSVQGCKRFMAEHIDNELVRNAMRKRDTLKKKVNAAKAKAREMQHKIKSIPVTHDAMSQDEISSNDAKAALAQKEFHSQEALIASTTELYDAAAEDVSKRQQSALNAAMGYVRDANFNSREIELNAREKKLNAKETELRSASQQLEQTADALRRAHDTRLVENFPQFQAGIREREEKVQVRERSLSQREEDMKRQAEALNAKVRAFESGVSGSIKKAMNDAGTTADSEYSEAQIKINTDVDSFQNELTRINDRSSTGEQGKAAAAVQKRKAPAKSKSSKLDGKAGAAVARKIEAGVDMVKDVMKKIDHAGEAVQNKKKPAEKKDKSDSATKGSNAKPDGIDGTERAVDENSALDDQKVKDDTTSEDTAMTP